MGNNEKVFEHIHISRMIAASASDFFLTYKRQILITINGKKLFVKTIKAALEFSRNNSVKNSTATVKNVKRQNIHFWFKRRQNH